mmetsp:Transcript_105100/g.272173  ORF Transcript_105100/g.272173 Transcript_105100/m.272173 type:complete len:84 (+) Transcript_105100:638-889(+)
MLLRWDLWLSGSPMIPALDDRRTTIEGREAPVIDGRAVREPREEARAEMEPRAVSEPRVLSLWLHMAGIRIRRGSVMACVRPA